MNPEVHCNDVHSRLNPVQVSQVLQPQSSEEVVSILTEAGRAGLVVSVCGARHAMGGQQFGESTLLLDMRGLKGVGMLDRERGLVEVGAGLTWPELLEELHSRQVGLAPVWTIRQKQTGADDLTLGGALAANIHGRGLRMGPIISDVEAFTLIDAAGCALRCSRTENSELFRLAIGGYGCFGVMTSVQLRLTERIKVTRLVETLTIDRLMGSFEERIGNGCLYGDFQFSIDETSDDFLYHGILSSYRPVEAERAGETESVVLGAEDWEELIHLAHTDRGRAFGNYVAHYLRTHGSLYWSDTHQLGLYLADYHCKLDQRLGSLPATEMISELYVPRHELVEFMSRAAQDLRDRGVPVIYGTVRLIERDTESFLPWAREAFACVIFNLHTEHSDEGVLRAAEAFRALIDLALSLGGSYYLTYHRWARRDQVERAYPAFMEFLRAKEKYDPEGRFQSEWWRHYQEMFARE